MTAYVLDASVAAKWVLPSGGEPLASEAIRLLDDFVHGRIQLSVPDLFWPEFGNVLWKAVRAGRIGEKAAGESLASMRGLSLQTFPTGPLVPQALQIAHAFDRTVYDAVYVVLAVLSGRPLMTADERLANALGASFPVHWLGSLI